MATLTYDPTPADQPEFSEEELDSLQRGEEMQGEEQQLLAGKYQNAEELEKAYIELQQRLGGGEEESESTEEETEEEVEEEVSAGEVLITDASQEFAEKGELSPETMEQFNNMSSQELVQAYMDYRANNPTEEAPSADLSEGQINTIMNQAGGETSYNNLVAWAGQNLPENYITAFDNIVDSGNMEAITMAVAGLKSQYEEVNGYEGRMLSGKGAPQQVDAFRSQAEVVQAMADPRYDSDPAYRNDVFEKLSRSNIDY
jgi:hypothetical protein